MRTAAEEKTESKTELDYLGKIMQLIADEVQNKVKIEGYSFTTKLTTLAFFYVIVKGAEGDTTVMREGRKQLTKILDSAVAKHFKKFGEGFKPKVTVNNKGDDLHFTCEIIIP